MEMSAHAWLLLVLIGGPILFGLLAWLSRNERARSLVVVMAALCTAAAGLAVPFRGSFTVTGGGGLRLLGDGLEIAMPLIVLAIGIKRRIWLVVALASAQLLVAGAEHFVHASELAPPAFVADPLSTILVLVVSLVGSAIVVYGLGYMREHEHHAPASAASNGRFFFFLTGFLGLMNGLVLADSLKWLSVFWEGTTLCSFYLIGHDGTLDARKSARRALEINTFGGLLLSLGVFLSVRQGGNGSVSGMAATAAAVPLILLVLAAFTKSAQLPFQSWLLGAMVAPTPVSALLHSSTMVKAGSYLVLRLAPSFLGTPVATVIAIAGAFTFAITSAIAISQSNAKKVLAYSTIANLGLIVACAAIDNPLAYSAALVILIYHAVSKALLFLCVGTIEQQIGSRNIDDMGGILFKMPLTTIVAITGMITMMAPPFGMLIGKWMAISAAGRTPLVLLLFVVGSALTIMFWAKWMGRIITTSYHETYQQERLPGTMKFVQLLLVTVAVLGGLVVIPAYRQFLRPLALSTFAHVGQQQIDSQQLLASVDAFMGWPLFVMLALVILVAVVSLTGLRKPQVRLPFLCGENFGEGARGFEFRSAMDQKTTAQVSSYYLATWFGEKVMTKWANLIAALILLSLLARTSSALWIPG